MKHKNYCMDFLEKTTDIYFFISDDFSIQDMNPSARTFFQLDDQRNTNASFLDLCMGDRKIISTYFDKSDTHGYRTLMRHCINDSYYFIRWEIITVKGSGDLIHGYNLLGRNDTDLYEKNKAVKAKLLLYENIFSELPTNVYWKDKNSVYLGCNKRLAESIGLPSKESINGMTDFDLDWGIDGAAESFIAFDRKVIETGKALKVEDTFQKKNGRLVTVLTNKAPLVNVKGEVEGVLAISVDITDLKEAQENLEIEKERAEAANKAKSEFIANMSHDIKTPLSGIISGADFLGHKISDPDLKSFANDVLVSGEKLLEFFDSTLALSMIEEHDVVIESKCFNLKALVNDLLDFFRMSLKMSSINVSVDFDDRLPVDLMGSSLHVYRILQNLLGNAIKFTNKEGSVKLAFYCEDQSVSDDFNVTMVVEDTGIGIPKDKHDEIFEKFNRLTSSYEGVYEGHGLGLYMVKQFVNLMNGEIVVESEEGKGSRFILTLPFKLPDLVMRESAGIDAKILEG